jgi:hypothetical protein
VAVHLSRELDFTRPRARKFVGKEPLLKDTAVLARPGNERIKLLSQVRNILAVYVVWERFIVIPLPQAPMNTSFFPALSSQDIERAGQVGAHDCPH